jgi:hemerythrin superfamily protein
MALLRSSRALPLGASAPVTGPCLREPPALTVASVAGNGVVMSDPQRDVIEILTHDHRQVEEMFGQLEVLAGKNDEPSLRRRKDLVDQVTIELIRHSVAEEAEVYPKVKERISEQEAEQAKHEHAEAELTMKRLEPLRPGDRVFDEQLATLMQEIREHVAEEESQMFADLRANFSAQELVEMGARVERVKKMAPTRPHPSAPDAPPGDKILGPVTGMFDRMRDAVSHRGTS